MPKKTAFLFPGQGSQFIGMGKEWQEASETARGIFAQADEIMGRSISAICFEGPEDELKKTENTQPGIFLCSVVGAALLAEAGVTPDYVAGHSLGEYAAVVAAGALDWEAGLRLVRARGGAMNEASEKSRGTMAAILGLEEAQVLEACAKVGCDELKPANFNGPGQIVISGPVDAVEKAVEFCKEAGAKRAVILPVHGAFHSPLMAPAVPVLQAALAQEAFADPRAVYVSAVTGAPVPNAADVRQILADQMTSAVRWTDTVQALLDAGVELFVEVGPGKVLSGILKRMDRSAQCLACATPEDMEAVVAAYNE